MSTKQKLNFGEEMAKLHPVILRSVMKRQESVFKKGNLAITHIVVLEYLGEKGSCTMTELSRVLNLTTSAVTVIVDKMISMKLVKRERSVKDRRIVNVELLSKGKETVKEADKEKISMINNIYSVLTEGEKEEFLKLMTKVYDDLRKKL